MQIKITRPDGTTVEVNDDVRAPTVTVQFAAPVITQTSAELGRSLRNTVSAAERRRA